MDLPRLIVLRIWIGPARFRVVARELGSGKTRSFADAGTLLDYLRGDNVQAPDRCRPRPTQHR
jgi:hypothetical protein